MGLDEVASLAYFLKVNNEKYLKDIGPPWGMGAIDGAGLDRLIIFWTVCLGKSSFSAGLGFSSAETGLFKIF